MNIKLNSILFYIMIILTMGCTTRHISSTHSAEESQDSVNSASENSTVTIFGTTIHKNETTAIRELVAAGILQCDTIIKSDGQFYGAIIEFASVRFNLNKNYIFITSRQDQDAIDSLITKISYYYGMPEIDGEDESSSYYDWNLYNSLPGKPHIRLRNLHSEDGGLVMTWDI